MNSLISSDNVLLVWMIVIVMTTFAIFAEQKFKWGAFIGSAVIAIFFSMILCNLHITPTSSPVYTAIGAYVLPLSIPLLLFKCNVRKIIKESGKEFIYFHIAAVGTVAAAFICGFIWHSKEEIAGVAAMTSGAFVGGTVNLVAMGNVFNMDAQYINAVAVGANILLGFLMLLLSVAGNFKFFRSHFRHPYIDEFESGADKTKSMAAQYWKPKNISLLTLAMCLAATFVITGISSVICTAVNATDAPMIVKQLFGNIYLIMTLITATVSTIFPDFFAKLEGAEELGNLAITIWFTTLGCAATAKDVLAVGYVLVFMAIVIVINFLVSMFFGHMAKGSYEEMAIASCATVGGPTTAAALAINKGWGDLIVPGILVGLWGYIIGNYLGVVVGDFFL